MAYPLYFTANAMYFLKETYINIAAQDIQTSLPMEQELTHTAVRGAFCILI